MSNYKIGVNIGAEELKLAVRRRGNYIVMSERLPENIIQNGRIVMPESMVEFLRGVRKKYKIRGGGIAAVLPDGLTILRRISMPYMTEAQLKINLPYEFRDFISGTTDKYEFDYSVEGFIKGDDGKITTMNLLAVAIQKSIISDYQEVFRRAGMKLSAAIPQEVAYINLIREHIKKVPDNANREICIVDIGHRRTHIHMFEGEFYRATCTVDYGSAGIDEAIADTLNVDVYLACTYKESNYEGILDCEALENVYNKISLEAMKAINFYRYNNPDNRLTDAYFAGGGAMIKKLVDMTAAAADLIPHNISELLTFDVSGDSVERAALAVGATLQ